MPKVKVIMAPRKVESVEVVFTPAEIDLMLEVYHATSGLAVNANVVVHKLTVLRDVFRPIFSAYGEPL